MSSDAIVISVAGTAAGLVVRQRRGYRFFASTSDFRAIDRRCFRRVRDAQQAVKRILAGEPAARGQA